MHKSEIEEGHIERLILRLPAQYQLTLEHFAKHNTNFLNQGIENRGKIKYEVLEFYFRLRNHTRLE
jgi:hypothetical protein